MSWTGPAPSSRNQCRSNYYQPLKDSSWNNNQDSHLTQKDSFSNVNTIIQSFRIKHLRTEPFRWHTYCMYSDFPKPIVIRITSNRATVMQLRGARTQLSYFPIRCTTHSCWQSGQRLFCFTQSDMQQLWNEWLHSPQTTEIKNKIKDSVKLHKLSRSYIQCPKLTLNLIVSTTFPCQSNTPV